MAQSSPPSDSSEPVLVSRPSSPQRFVAGTDTSTTAPTSGQPGLSRAVDSSSSAASGGAPFAAKASHFSTASPAPPVRVIKDTASETVAAPAPTSANTTSGLGRPGEEQRAHLEAPGKVLGGAEGVVGESYGAAPEWIVKVRKDRGGAGADGAAGQDETVVGPTTDSRSLPDGAVGSMTPVDEDDDEDAAGRSGSGKPKWFKKVKDGLSTAAASIKDKASSDAGSITSASGRAGGSGGSILGRGRARSVGQRSTVSFDEGVVGGEEGDEAATKAAATKIVTDHEGRPVPLNVGASAEGATPPSSTPEGAVPASAPAAGSASGISATTSVKDKILESFDAEPATTQEKFHSMFNELPEDEELIEDYRCALQREILVQGKLYVSEHYLSFRASILGWETTLKIPWTEIVSIEKRFTAKIIPNAIEIRTLHATHTFSSFVARDASFALVVAVWKHVHPEADELEAASRKAAKAEKRRLRALSSAAASTRSAPELTSDTDGDSDAKSEITFEDEHGHKKRHRFKHTLAALKIGKLGGSSASTSSASASAPGGGPTEAEKVKAQAQAGSGAGAGDGAHAATTYDGPEFKNVALDTVLPTSPALAYKLFFADAEFLKAFMEGKEGLKEVDIGAWKPANGACEERDLTYLKPLNAPVGPKQTHCLIHDLNEQRDDDSVIVNLTSTKTPDVPSGDNFATMTRTAFTWAEGGGCRVRVTTEVEWTKVNRLLRGVIERGAVDGQVGYHKDLEAAVREHIAANPDEYAIAGSAPAAAPAAGVKSTDTAAAEPSSSGSRSLVDSVLDPDRLVVALIVIVAILAFSNLFTLVSLRKHAAAVREARIGHPAEVASAVERVLGQFNAAHAQRAVGPAGHGPSGEVAQLKEALRALEGHIEGVLRDVGRAVGTVRELADRAEGVKGML
ncbi:hypothetical protein JCM9279_003136 [Rhodotorula babjevae]